MYEMAIPYYVFEGGCMSVILVDIDKHDCSSI